MKALQKFNQSKISLFINFDVRFLQLVGGGQSMRGAQEGSSRNWGDAFAIVYLKNTPDHKRNKLN